MRFALSSALIIQVAAALSAESLAREEAISLVQSFQAPTSRRPAAREQAVSLGHHRPTRDQAVSLGHRPTREQAVSLARRRSRSRDDEDPTEGLARVDPKPQYFEARTSHHAENSSRLRTPPGEPPAFCTTPAQKGYVNVHGNERSRDVLLDLTDALKDGEGKMALLVTAMASRGTYSAETGQQVMPLSSPLEDAPHQMLELSLSPFEDEVDVFAPQLRIRTSDKESREALKMGTGDGRLGSIPRVVCGAAAPDSRREGASVHKLEAEEAQSESRVLIDANSLLGNGFFVVRDMDFWSLGGVSYKRMSTRVKSLKSYPKNIDMVVEMMLGAQGSNRQIPLTVEFSMVRLPRIPMAPRASDNRLGYFASTFSDLGFRPDEINTSWSPSSTVDAQRTMIWRYNLDRDKDKQIKIYIDPTVPQRWRKYVKEGIEAWNDGFALFGGNNTMKAIAPGHPDWPKDYDQGDARYTVVTWVLDTNKVVSRGHARVDPRSGEIVKSEISMSVGWLHAWLSDVDRLAPQLVQQSGTGFVQEERPQASAGDAASAAAEFSDPRSHEAKVADARAALLGGSEAMDSSLLHLVAGSDSRLGLLHEGSPMTARKQEEVLGSGIKQIIMHETGHILGLRHNFKGSLGVSYECTQDKACSGKYGLSASVMDYLPINLPDNDDPDSVHFFSPVIGEYDKLAIAYGYTPVDNKKLKEDSDLSLQSYLKKAEEFQVCLDGDSSQGEDPQCRPYDFTSDPVRYFETTLAKHRHTHQHLLDTVVAPGKPYFHYGNAVATLMGMTRDMGLKVSGYIGGVNSSYTHRSDLGAHGGDALRYISAETQRQALGVAKQVLRLNRSGLLPPPAGRRYLVAGEDDRLQSFNVDHAARSIQKELMKALVSPTKMERLYDHAGDCEGKSCPLKLEELLSELVGEFGVPKNATSPDWDVQLELVEGLKAAAATAGMAAEIESIISHQLSHITSATESQLERGDRLRTWAPSGWQECAKEGGHCKCRGQVRFGVDQSWSELRRVSDDKGVACKLGAFQDPKPYSGKVCQCLSELAGEQERYHRHLLRLHSMLA